MRKIAINHAFLLEHEILVLLGYSIENVKYPKLVPSLSDLLATTYQLPLTSYHCSFKIFNTIIQLLFNDQSVKCLNLHSVFQPCSTCNSSWIDLSQEN